MKFNSTKDEKNKSGVKIYNFRRFSDKMHTLVWGNWDERKIEEGEVYEKAKSE